jgi:hypothetical protein
VLVTAVHEAVSGAAAAEQEAPRGPSFLKAAVGVMLLLVPHPPHLLALQDVDNNALRHSSYHLTCSTPVACCFVQ